jgi:hypothetical protein
MQQSLDALSQNLTRLNNELAGCSGLGAKRRRTDGAGRLPMGTDDVNSPDHADSMMRKRKIPQSFQLFPKNGKQTFEHEGSPHWTTILRTQILDESSNEVFKERRKELLQLMRSTDDDSKVIISAKPKKNHSNLN